VRFRTIILLALVCAAASFARAQQGMTREQAIARARTRAPLILASRDRSDESRGRLTGASILLQENPMVETAVGPRYSPNGDTTDYDITLSQPFELGGRRGARIAGARAGIDRETAMSRDVARRLLRDVSVAFVRGLAAKERFSLAETSSKIADELFQSMSRRY
jgi:outer membrane protein, heavy metal efflux system